MVKSEFVQNLTIEMRNRILIEDFCDEFEQSWKNGSPRSVHEIANGAPDELRLLLLRELIVTEHRLMAGAAKHKPLESTAPNLTRLGLDETFKTQADIPNRVGHYAPKYILGNGSAGVVYAAIDLDSNDWVALKMPHSYLLNSDEGKRRFLREARNAEGLDHPNIVRFLHAGDTGYGPYLVYEFLQGLDLCSCLKHGATLSTRQKLRVISDACLALQYAHERGVVHRDIKPSNMMVLFSADRALAIGPSSSEDLQIKLLDFGIARVLESTTVMTVAGEVLGTPAYMSPEQASGQSNQANQQSDIYGIGVVLYELLTGTTPFTGTHQEVTRRISTEEVPLLSVTHPSIPIPIATICNRCLRLSPRQRYAKISMVSEDIEHYLQGKAISAKPVGLIEQTFSHWRRHQFSRLAKVACIAALVTLVIAGVTSTWLIDLARQQNGVVNSKLSPIKRWLSTNNLRDIKTLEEELPKASIEDMLALVQQSGAIRVRVVEGLVRIKAGNTNPSVALLCETLLSVISPERLDSGSNLTEIAEYIAHRVQSNEAEQWIRFVEPIASKLATPFETIYKRETKPGRRSAQRSLLLEILRNDTSALLALIGAAQASELTAWSTALSANPKFDRSLLELDWMKYEIEHNHLGISDEACESDSNYALVQYGMGDMEEFLRSLHARLDPRVCTYVMHRFSDTGLPIEPLLRRMLIEKRPDVLYGLMTIYAFTFRDRVDRELLDECDDWVFHNYSKHPDAGVHGMCRYLFAKHCMAAQATTLDQELIQEGARGRDWFVSKSGFHFAVIRKTDNFWLGDKEKDVHAKLAAQGYFAESLRPFAIAMDKMKLWEARRLQRIQNQDKALEWPGDNAGSYREIGAFFNSVNREERFQEFVIEANDHENQQKTDFKNYSGYRFPTTSELEYASRGGTGTEQFQGSKTMYSKQYVTSREYNTTKIWTLPNRFGLFNTFEVEGTIAIRPKGTIVLPAVISNTSTSVNVDRPSMWESSISSLSARMVKIDSAR